MRVGEHRMPVFRHENQVGVQRENAMSTCTNISVLSHEPRILFGMRLRYRHRIYPDAAQRQALARAFGCARVVYNDGLRLGEDAYRAGLPYPSDGELSHRLTLAKLTPERAWLGKVSSVVLQQSLADLHRAYRNYFRALKEYKAAGRGARRQRSRSASPGSRTVATTRRPGSPPTAVSGCWATVACPSPRWAT